MARILWVLNTPDGAPKFIDKLHMHEVEIVQQRILDGIDLGVYDSIVLTMHSDQRHLQRLSGKLESFLTGGGAIIFNGHVAHPFLPGLSPFRPIEQKGLKSFRIHIVPDQPPFDGLGSDDLTFQKGVAGFYSRGSNPPPDGAAVLTTIGVDKVPVDWIASYGAGRLFVHCGNDLFSFLHRADPEGCSVLDRFFSHFERATHELCGSH